MLKMEEDLTLLSIPTADSKSQFEINISKIFITTPTDDVGEVNVINEEYEQFLADVWVGIVLTLMVLSCVCFMCSCLIYHKFQQWKSRVIEARNAANVESGPTMEIDLPSYTIASGLPSYEEALEQLKKVKELSKVHHKPVERSDSWVPQTPPTPLNSTLSVVHLFQLYKTSEVAAVSTKPS